MKIIFLSSLLATSVLAAAPVSAQQTEVAPQGPTEDLRSLDQRERDLDREEKHHQMRREEISREKRELGRDSNDPKKD
ncbi:hypothetical protein [Methylobacterium nigriterrae]|uniref:hypothetical protein n=1 Tax=Methylobacterium nigriterrae TaxID=3127512 RepID=UPI0030136085